MKAALAAIFVLAAIAAGCGGASSRPGNPAVYERIAAETDCDTLQGEFDQAMTNHDHASGDKQREWTLAYAKAADSRMNDLGCYG